MLNCKDYYARGRTRGGAWCRLVFNRLRGSLGGDCWLSAECVRLCPGTSSELVFTALALQALDILLVSVDLGLVAIDLLLLLVVGVLMTL